MDGVDEKKAGDALASLQRPILRAVGTGGPQVPSFQSKEIDGVAVPSVQVSPSVDLSYAIFEGCASTRARNFPALSCST